MSVRRAFPHVVLCIVLGFSGCKKPEPVPISAPELVDRNRPLPPGQLALRKITDPAMLPAFAQAYYSAKDGQLEQSIRNSLHYLAKPSSQKFFPYGEVTHEQAVASLNAFLEIVNEATTPQQFEEIIKQRFDTYMSVGYDDKGSVLFTGYYCPIFNGSLTRTDQFRYPLYKRPAGLQINPNDPDGGPMGGPWKTREEIDSGQALAGQELVWLGDRFEAYVIGVQGSGKIRLPNGTLYEVGYSGNNGHEYTSVAGQMIADGRLSKEQLNLDAMIAYFRAHPGDLDTYLNRNKRYIFFQEIKGGPFGCLGEPVLPMHSIAVDKTVFPRACLAMADTTLALRPGLGQQHYMGFACDQDRGGAIRAAGRCDIFRGTGDEAGKLAGHTFAEGRLYYIFLKPEYMTGQTTDMARAPAGKQPVVGASNGGDE